jgi:hypothetical protein
MFKPSSSKGNLAAAGAGQSYTQATLGPLAAGWLRSKGRDTGSLATAVAGNRLQQMKSWNLWWTVLTRVNPGSASSSTATLGALFTLRCYADEQLSQLKVRSPVTRRPPRNATPAPAAVPYRLAMRGWRGIIAARAVRPRCSSSPVGTQNTSSSRLCCRALC